MKPKFEKRTIFILTALGLCAAILIAITLITEPENKIMPTLAMSFMFLFGIYYYYAKNRLYTSKEATIFPLFNKRTVNKFNFLMLTLIFVVLVFCYFKFGMNNGIWMTTGIIAFNLLIMFLFPYRSGYLIKTDKEGIYSYETGYIKWEMIQSYSINETSTSINLTLNNNENQTIPYNKYVDIETLKSLLQTQIKKLRQNKSQTLK